jgi:hypothetical protein
MSAKKTSALCAVLKWVSAVQSTVPFIVTVAACALRQKKNRPTPSVSNLEMRRIVAPLLVSAH